MKKPARSYVGTTQAHLNLLRAIASAESSFVSIVLARGVGKAGWLKEKRR